MPNKEQVIIIIIFMISTIENIGSAVSLECESIAL